MRVLCYDRKTGNIYHASCDVPDKSVIILKNPVCRQTAYTNAMIFNNGSESLTTEYMYYGEVRHDIMVSIEHVFVEILPEDAYIDWVERTKEKVDYLLDLKKQELEKKSAEDKQKYYKDNSPLYIFFKKFFS